MPRDDEIYDDSVELFERERKARVAITLSSLTFVARTLGGNVAS